MVFATFIIFTIGAYRVMSVLGIFHLVKAYTKLSYGERLIVKPSPGESLPNYSLSSGERQNFDHQLNTLSMYLVLAQPAYLLLLYNIS